jgi:hypothetical protein
LSKQVKQHETICLTKMLQDQAVWDAKGDRQKELELGKMIAPRQDRHRWQQGGAAVGRAVQDPGPVAQQAAGDG